jgi:hypothetical protein
MQVILGKNPETPVYAYANAVGLGADPGILGETFYSYYTEWPTGESWNPAAIKRLTITTAATLTRIVPSNRAIGGSAFTLTVNGDHFVKTSTVTGNGSPRATTYVSETQLPAQILSSDIASPGEANVGVSNHPHAAAPPRRNHSRCHRLWDLISSRCPTLFAFIPCERLGARMPEARVPRSI